MLSKEGFSEVRRSKRLIERSGKRLATARSYPSSAETGRLSAVRCTEMYQAVATRNIATAREILALG